MRVATRCSNRWSRHVSAKDTVTEAYDQLACKGVIEANATQREMAEACTPLLSQIHRCYAEKRQRLTAATPGGLSHHQGVLNSPVTQMTNSFQQAAIKRLGASRDWLARHFPDRLTRTIGLMEAENIGISERRGVYLWGSVGIGKTMILDLFDLCNTPYQKRRCHLHSFMTEVADRLFRAEIDLSQQRRVTSSAAERQALAKVRPIDVVVAEVLQESPILCFDEFQTFDVAHAALLASFFTLAFQQGLFLLTTSNRPPEDLCYVSASFTTFLPLLRQHCHVIHCGHLEDYRSRHTAAESCHDYIFLHPNTTANAERLVRRVESGMSGSAGVGVEDGGVEWAKDEAMQHHGRYLVTPYRCGGCAVFDFTDLCGRREGYSSSDIEMIATQYHTVVVTNVPQIGLASSNAAHQFIVLVDELYQSNVKLLFTSAVSWDRLLDASAAGSDLHALGSSSASYSEGEDDRSGYTADYKFQNEEELMSFARIHSRLQEMGSSSYLLRDHRHFVVSDFDFSALLKPDILKVNS